MQIRDAFFVLVKFFTILLLSSLLMMKSAEAARVVVGVGVGPGYYEGNVVWVPGHWHHGYWIPGQYVEYPGASPGPDFVWFGGGYYGGYWHRGHWGHGGGHWGGHHH